MSKRLSPLDRAIAKLDTDIAVLVAARERLQAQQPARLREAADRELKTLETDLRGAGK